MYRSILRVYSDLLETSSNAPSGFIYYISDIVPGCVKNAIFLENKCLWLDPMKINLMGTTGQATDSRRPINWLGTRHSTTTAHTACGEVVEDILNRPRSGIKKVFNIARKLIRLWWFEYITAVTMESAIFWIVTLCSSEEVRRIRRTYNLHLQGRRVSQAGNHQ
jgi:hypothetical protein